MLKIYCFLFLLVPYNVFCQKNIQFVDEFEEEINITKKGVHESITDIYAVEKGNLLIYGLRDSSGLNTLFFKKINKNGEVINEKKYSIKNLRGHYVDNNYNLYVIQEKSDGQKILINLIKFNTFFEKEFETGFKLYTDINFLLNSCRDCYIVPQKDVIYFVRNMQIDSFLITKIALDGKILLEKKIKGKVLSGKKSFSLSDNIITQSYDSFVLPMDQRDSVKILTIDEGLYLKNTELISLEEFSIRSRKNKIIASFKSSGKDGNDILVEKFDERGNLIWDYSPANVRDERAWGYQTFKDGYLIVGSRGGNVFYFLLSKDGKLLEDEKNLFSDNSYGRIVKTSDNSFFFAITKKGKDGRDNIFIKKFNFSGKMPPPPTQPNTWAISIGVTEYKNTRKFSRLKYSRRYANDFSENLEDIQLADRTVILTDEDATYKLILDTMKSVFLSSNVKKEDYIILYFSGHGEMTRNGKVGICPYDYYDVEHLISDEQIVEILKQSPAKHKAVFLEACRNLNDPIGIPQGDNFKFDEDKIKEFNRERNRIKDGIIFITSTKIGEYSWEYPVRENNEIRGGPFSYFLMKGIKGEANIYVKDHIITAQELFDYIFDNVTRVSNYKQIPQKNEELEHSPDTPLFIISN